MKSPILRAAILIGSLSISVVLFQNCSKNFEMADGVATSAGTTALGSSNPDHSQPHIAPLSTKMEPNTDIEFSVSADSILPSSSYEWSHTLNGNTGACNLKKGSASTSYVVNCAMPGNLAVKVVVTEGAVAKPALMYAAVLETPLAAGAEINLQVNFAIPSGTGATPWNSAITIVETFVGQTLKITNMDGVTHQLHTGGRPCGHGSAIASGASTNCVVSRAYDAKANGSVYDHNLGTKSPFFVIAHDGAALYATNCASCHGALAASTQKLARVSVIKNALTNVAAMKANTNLMNLSQRQLEAISFALGGK
ncbi:MAG: cytochrome c [Bdellovibrionaceae bacterium]|nr:cytochrome c [Pseudobdellovibrionaceae bacterium]